MPLTDPIPALQHVDKPPVAVPSQHTCLSRTYCELQLRGTDPDNAIVAAVITALPAGGQLFQVSGS
jgi:hypothetical protein